MAEAVAIEIPLLNPNEREVWIAALHVAEGEQVQAGAPLATIETTKSALELEAERAGYVVGLTVKAGQQLRAGDVICWIAEAPDWEPPAAAQPAEAVDDGLRLTEPARALATELGVDLDELPTGELITEARLRSLAAAADQDLPPVDPRQLIVYGGGGHGKAVIELIRALEQYELVGVIDDGLAAGGQVMGLEILGGGERLAELRQRGIGQAANAVGGIGDISTRVGVFERLQAAGFSFPTLVHPTAFVEPSAELAQGVQVFPQAYVGSEARLGLDVIVNTAAVVSHDCVIDKHANLAPGTLLAGEVSVGEGTLIGMGVTVNLSVQIGAGARVGNSAVIKADVPAGAIVRAGAVWPAADARKGEG